jgi:hypothetical protein
MQAAPIGGRPDFFVSGTKAIPESAQDLYHGDTEEHRGKHQPLKRYNKACVFDSR